jgi:hypothetical protein
VISLPAADAYGRYMSEFVLELYIPRPARSAVLERVEHARAGAEGLQSEGAAVRLLMAIFVPEDETCLLVYVADSADSVRRSARLAGLPVDHIVEAFVVEGQAA